MHAVKTMLNISGLQGRRFQWSRQLSPPI